MTAVTLAQLGEMKQSLNAMLQVGTICASKASEGRALVRVDILGRQSDWLPVLMHSNDFVKVWIPPRLGEQVLVISPLGDASSGFVITGIYNIGCKEPEGAGAESVIVEAGKCRFEMHKFDIKIKAHSGVTIEAPTVKMTGDLVVAGDISDSRGDLTGHTHSTTDGATAQAR